MSKKKYELTEEHRAQLKPWADQYIANAMSTKPMDDEERAICREAVKGIYRAANLEPPPDHRIVFVPSPFILRFAGGFAAAIWHLRKGLKQSTWAATRDATWAATRDATEDATRDATEDATRAATRDATRDATWAATRDATEDATWAATRDATRDATWAATRDATEDATGDATEDATGDATWAATRDATEDATGDATWAATRDATEDATGDATEDATGEPKDKWYSFNLQTMLRLSHALKLGELGLKCAANAYNMWNGGNQWSGYVAFLSFFRHVAKLGIDYSKFDHYEKLALHSGPRIMHEKFCMISDRPRVLKVNERNQPHCDTGPFCQWGDGSALYSLNGVRVPRWLVETSIDQLDPKQILALPNAEQRKEGIRKLGIDRFRDPLKVQVIHEWGDYELWSIEFEGRRIGPYLKMVNDSTGQIHVEGVGEITNGVDPSIKTCQEALAWRGGFRVFTNPEWVA